MLTIEILEERGFQRRVWVLLLELIMLLGKMPEDLVARCHPVNWMSDEEREDVATLTRILEELQAEAKI